MLLMNEQDAILVDISLCTGHTESKEWLTEKRAIVGVIGYVEREPIRVCQGRHGRVFPAEQGLSCSTEIERLAGGPKTLPRLGNTDARCSAAGFDGDSFWRRGYTRMERDSFTSGGASAT